MSTPTTPPTVDPDTTEPVGPYVPQPGPWQPTAAPTGLITVPVRPCCKAVLVRERCDCRAMRRQLRRAPVIHVAAGRAA